MKAKREGKSKEKLLSRVWRLATPWTTAYQAPLSMGFSRQEYWSGVPLPSPKVAQSCPALCDPVDYTIHGILQAKKLEWVVFPFSRGSSQPRDQTVVSRIAGSFFTSWATREAQYIYMYMCIYTYTYIYIHTHIYIYITLIEKTKQNKTKQQSCQTHCQKSCIILYSHHKVVKLKLVHVISTHGNGCLYTAILENHSAVESHYWYNASKWVEKSPEYYTEWEKLVLTLCSVWCNMHLFDIFERKN